MTQSIIPTGNSGTVDEVSSAKRTRNIVFRPKDVVYNGSYLVGHTTGVIAGVTNGLNNFIFSQFAMSGLIIAQDSVAVIHKIVVSAGAAGAAFGAGTVQAELVFARDITTLGSGASQKTASFNGYSARKRSSFAPSFIPNINTANTAAITAPTGAVDPQAIYAYTGCMVASALGTVLIPPTTFWSRGSTSEYPLVVKQGEMLYLRLISTPANAGSVTFTISVNYEWSEYVTYP